MLTAGLDIETDAVGNVIGRLYSADADAPTSTPATFDVRQARAYIHRDCGHTADTSCRRQIEKSPLAPIEMSLSPVFESDGELAADDGDFDEPFGDRSDERFARSGRGADQGF
jgi:hypothetical protein